MEDQEEGPIPFEDTPVPNGTPRYLFSYSLLEKQRDDGIVGAFKMIGSFTTEEELESLYNSSLPTNKQTQVAWGIPGEWEILRQPYTNLEGPLTVVDKDNKNVDEDSKTPIRTILNDPKNKEEIMDRFSIDAYKAKIKEAAERKKKVELRRKAMEELQNQFDDRNSLAFYSRLQYQRLAQADHIDELEQKRKDALDAHARSVKELRDLTRRFPHYKNQWQNEIRRLQKLMTNKESKFELKEGEGNDDWDVDADKTEREKDEFNEGILLEDKGKEESDAKFYDKEMEKEEKNRLHNELVQKAGELEDARKTIEEQKRLIEESFLPDAVNKPKKKKDKKKKKEKKPPKKK